MNHVGHGPQKKIQKYKVDCYVVHLQRDAARRWPMLREIIEAGFEHIKVFSAFDGKKKDMLKKVWARFYKKYPQSHRLEKCAVIFLNNHARQGCFLSHWSILELISNQKVGSMVFEDDVVFPKHFGFLWSLIHHKIQELGKSPDVVFFGHNAAIKHRDNFENLGFLPENVPVFATHAYFVSPRGAQKVIEYVSNYRPDAIDVVYKTMIDEKKLDVLVVNRKFIEKAFKLSYREAGRRETGIVFYDAALGTNIDHPVVRWFQDTFF